LSSRQSNQRVWSSHVRADLRQTQPSTRLGSRPEAFAIHFALPSQAFVGTLVAMPAQRRRPDVSWLPAVVPELEELLQAGDVTAGMTVKAYAGHLIVSRIDEQGADPRFRLTPLGQGAYGLSLHRRTRWEPLPFEGTLKELAETMNHELAAWADDWS
jgi:hypothetical protein